MDLDGLHHVTMITGDAPANVAFYADLLGLRLVKQTVNFDSPDAYRLDGARLERTLTPIANPRAAGERA